jgi:hypothetical protein
MPKRVRQRRAKKLPEGSKSVARPSRWGNPFKVSEHTPEAHAAAVEAFRAWITHPDQAGRREAGRRELRGFDLACYCAPDLPCHADVWLELVNA